MSERKVLNKYYPPDFDPSKIPRVKQSKSRQFTVRLMAPFNMRCTTCGEYIYKGKKFNARKEDVDHETYLGIRIYRFYIKCTRCLQEICFKTDPQNTDYEIEVGATRNFMALKLAEDQARRELEEEKEEEANNPMKLLENRTQQSRNEIELLESLEELQDLNRRQRSVNYDEMLKQYTVIENETPEQKEERLRKLDDEYIKQIKFRSASTGPGAKRVVEEEVLEVEDLANKRQKPNEPEKAVTTLSSITFKKPVAKSGFGIKASLANLVKPKASATTVSTISSASDGKASGSTATSGTSTATATSTSSVTTNKPNALSMLGSYDDSDDSDD